MAVASQRLKHSAFYPSSRYRAQAVEEFTDVRGHQRRPRSQGLKLTTEADESRTGPARFVAVDPDGNPVLIDEHVQSVLPRWP